MDEFRYRVIWKVDLFPEGGYTMNNSQQFQPNKLGVVERQLTLSNIGNRYFFEKTQNSGKKLFGDLIWTFLKAYKRSSYCQENASLKLIKFPLTGNNSSLNSAQRYPKLWPIAGHIKGYNILQQTFSVTLYKSCITFTNHVYNVDRKSIYTN